MGGFVGVFVCFLLVLFSVKNIQFYLYYRDFWQFKALLFWKCQQIFFQVRNSSHTRALKIVFEDVTADIWRAERSPKSGTGLQVREELPVTHDNKCGALIGLKQNKSNCLVRNARCFMFCHSSPLPYNNLFNIKFYFYLWEPFVFILKENNTAGM